MPLLYICKNIYIYISGFLGDGVLGILINWCVGAHFHEMEGGLSDFDTKSHDKILWKKERREEEALGPLAHHVGCDPTGPLKDIACHVTIFFYSLIFFWLNHHPYSFLSPHAFSPPILEVVVILGGGGGGVDPSSLPLTLTLYLSPSNWITDRNMWANVPPLNPTLTSYVIINSNMIVSGSNMSSFEYRYLLITTLTVHHTHVKKWGEP